MVHVQYPTTPSLLDVIDAMVRRDGGPPGFRGRIGLGVRSSDGGQRWWNATFVRTGCTSFFGDVGAWDADVLVCIGEVEAKAILEKRGLLRPTLLAFDGDLEMFDRFIARYLRTKSALDVRGARCK